MEVACSGGSLHYKIKSVNIFSFNFTYRKKHLIFALVVVSVVLERFSKPHTVKTTLCNTLFQKQMAIQPCLFSCPKQYHLLQSRSLGRTDTADLLVFPFPCACSPAALTCEHRVSLVWKRAWARCVLQCGDGATACWPHISPFPGLKKGFLLNTLEGSLYVKITVVAMFVVQCVTKQNKQQSNGLPTNITIVVL